MRSKRSSVAVVMAMALFVFANYYDCVFRSGFDMNARCGVPFERWQDGNFGGIGAGVLWRGLIADIVVGVLLAGVVGWITQRVFTTRGPQSTSMSDG